MYGRRAPPDAEHANELRIDLDPTPGVTFPIVQEATREVCTLLAEVGIANMPKTTGNRGIHVYVRLQPRWTPYDVRAAAVAVARAGAVSPGAHNLRVVEGGTRQSSFYRLQPERAAQDGLRRLVGARAAGAQVSTPFAWEELDRIHSTP